MKIILLLTLLLTGCAQNISKDYIYACTENEHNKIAGQSPTSNLSHWSFSCVRQS